MSPEEKHPTTDGADQPPGPLAVAETGKVVQATPLMTREEFATSLEELTARAKAAGLRPLQVMAQTYVKQGMAMLDGLLKALDEGNPKTPVEAPDDHTKKKS